MKRTSNEERLRVLRCRADQHPVVARDIAGHVDGAAVVMLALLTVPSTAPNGAMPSMLN